MGIMTRSPLLRMLVALVLVIAFVAGANAYARLMNCHATQPECPPNCDIYTWGCDWCEVAQGQCAVWIKGWCDEIFCVEPCILGDCVIISR